MTNYDDTLDNFIDVDNQDSELRNPLELLAAEFSNARRRGLNPSVDEYADRLPDQRHEAVALLQSICLLEQASDDEFTRFVHRRSKKHATPELKQLGDFRIIREIGRGGMGIIYEAEQVSLKRHVALKVLGPGIADSPRQLERFHRESEAVARLHHTNIVPVFGSGSENGVHYFAMQLIDGRPLNEPPELSYAQIAKLGLQAASALAYAHEHGVLHRDIKPSNLLLDYSGNVWVTDFGLAKLSNVGDLTQTGDIMGTLKYMAPEQLEGSADERTDVYALGLTLYELVTRQPAFDISKSLVNRIRNHEFAAPRSIDKNIPRDLETIILKATAREGKHRYAAAGDMADDLRRYIEDRPIEARRTTAAERLGRWIRRNPALAGSLAATLLLLLATTIVTTVGYVTTHRALQDAKDARDRAFDLQKDAEEARGQAVASQQRAEHNLNTAVTAFDAIFDNVARRGVPQSLSLNLDSPNSLTAATSETAVDELTQDATPAEAPRFESSLTTADAELLGNLLQFYREFAKQNDDDGALRLRTALAYQRIGQIQERLGQGTESIASYDEALDIVMELHKGHPQEDNYIVQAAKILNDRGLALSAKDGHLFEVVGTHQAAIRFIKSQSEAVQQLPDVRFELARAYDLAGSLLGRGGALNLAFDQPMGGPRGGRGPSSIGPGSMGPGSIGPGAMGPDGLGPGGPGGPFGPDGGMEFRRPNGPRPGGPDSPDNKRPNDQRPNDQRPDDRGGPGLMSPDEEAVVLGGLRRLFRRVGIVTGLDDPRDIFPGFGGRPSTPPGQVGSPGNDHNPFNMGPGSPNQRRPQEQRPRGEFGDGGPPESNGMVNLVAQELLQARDIFEGLCQEFPDNTDYRLAYAQTQRHLMMHFTLSMRTQEATEAFDKARETLVDLLEANPSDPKIMLELADTLSSGSVRLKSLDPSSAEQLLRQSIATCQKLCAAFQSVPEYQAILAGSQDKLGSLEASRKNWKAADREYQLACERLLDLHSRFPEHRFYHASALLAAIHFAENRLLREAQLDDPKSMDTAAAFLERAIADYKPSESFDPFTTQSVVRAMRNLSQLQMNLGDFDAADETREKIRQFLMRK